MKRILVTGGAGFIGSHIVQELTRRKYRVRVLDNFCSGKKENLSYSAGKFELLTGDIRSKKTCLKATKGIDAVLHQAALRSVPKSIENPKEYNEVNIQGTLNMLEAAVESKAKSFVFASSSSIYGDTDKFPEKEDFLPQPISPYALTKLAGEHYCRMFSYHYKISTVCLRYFNVFGPRQSLDDEYAVVIPKFIHCVLHDQQPPIFGTGKQSRDFTFVGNVVAANILGMQKLNSCGEVFNVASGHDYTINEFVKILNKLAHKNIKARYLPLRKGDVFRTLADLSYAKKKLKFNPKIDFIQGLKLTLDYFRSLEG